VSIFRVVLCCVMVAGVAILTSCKKESTPADKINATTETLEGEAAKLKTEAETKKVEAENAEAPTVDLPKTK